MAQRTTSKVYRFTEQKDLADSISYVLELLEGDWRKKLSEADLAFKVGTHYIRLLHEKGYLKIKDGHFEVTDKFLQNCT